MIKMVSIKNMPEILQLVNDVYNILFIMAQKTNGVVKAFELTNLSTNSELVYYLDFNNLGAVGSPCVWSINLPAVQGQTKRFLKVQSANASVISGTAATYTQSFAIKSNATTGYMDKNGNPTNTLCYVIPKDVNAFVY